MMPECTYKFDTSVNDTFIDRDAVVFDFTQIDTILEQLGADEVDKLLYDHCKNEILAAYDSIMKRLQHSEAERFSK